MKVCVLGDGLTGLTLAKSLVNLGISVDLFLNKELKNINKTRSIGISHSNLEFFKRNILDIEKISWNIKKIEIFNSKSKDKKLFNFEKNNQTLFSMVRNHELQNLLIMNLKKSKLFKIQKKSNLKKIRYDYYKLIINCDLNNFVTKKFFSKKIKKNYNANAYTTIINHKKLSKNNIAKQFFTERGPLAFLPLSQYETSIVYSASGRQDVNLKNVIKIFNTEYSIRKINKISSFDLKSINLRSYYYKNILAFGDLLHKIHPLAGQGFNMTLRDIKELLYLIKFKMRHGLDLDTSICKDFEKRNRHKNYFFTSGIDFIYEFFKFENKIKNNLISKSIKFIVNNKYTNKFLIKFADEGLRI